MATKKNRVCIIGAGPSGMAALYRLAELKGDNACELVCYEKQKDWGGMWNFSWRTGLDENGEPTHTGMYRNLWANAPKECFELPEYTFEQHFGKVLPSFLPRAFIKEYMKGRWKTCSVELRPFIRFGTVVTNVLYNESTNDFSVWAKTLAEDLDNAEERFSHVVVASGIFSVPNVPSFPGLDSFPGRVIHAHDFRDAREFEGKRMLVIGSSFSAEDIALQCKKFGSGPIICSWRTKPTGFKWPAGVEERPLLKSVAGNTATFQDDSSADVDAIIFCTGYIYKYPFLRGELRLQAKQMAMLPDKLFKGLVWTDGGNDKLLYIGAQLPFFSFSMYDIQGVWIARYVSGASTLPDRKQMLAEVQEWYKKNETVTDHRSAVALLAEYVKDLVECVDYPARVVDARELFYKWIQQKAEDITTYKDKPFPSLYTGTMASTPKLPYMEVLDDTLHI